MYIPDGYGTVFPYIFVNDANAYIRFLRGAFGAQELGRTEFGGRVANARVRIGTTCFMVSDAQEGFPASASAFYVFVEDSDASYKTALEHGVTAILAPMDMPYGDRQGGVRDPEGNIWWISTRIAGRPYD